MTIYSYDRYIGDGSTTIFSLNRDYLEEGNITVKVDDVIVSHTWQDSTTVELAVAPADGSIIDIRRTTKLDTLINNYSNGAVFASENLNAQSTQLLFVVQEAADNAVDTIRKDSTDNYDTQNKKLKNVADATEDTDAVNKAQLESFGTTITASETSAAASAAAASLSEVDAKTSETNASSSEGNAATHASNASSSASVALTSAATTTTNKADVEAIYTTVNTLVNNYIALHLIAENVEDLNSLDELGTIDLGESSTSTGLDLEHVAEQRIDLAYAKIQTIDLGEIT